MGAVEMLEPVQEATPANRPLAAATASQALAFAPAQGDSRALMSMIQTAMSRPDFDVEKLERLLLVKERWEADEARKAYHAAMAEFKKNPPTIFKDNHVYYEKKDGSPVSYDHATLGHIVKQVTVSLSEHGLSASWNTERKDARVYVTCTLTHRLGHSQSVTLDCAPDDSGGKNSIQAVGSAITYLQRYTLLAATGLATEFLPDDDGRGAGSESGGSGGAGAPPSTSSEPPAYPADLFEKNLPTWRQHIAEGRTDPEKVIRTVETKGRLTEIQKTRIRAK